MSDEKEKDDAAEFEAMYDVLLVPNDGVTDFSIPPGKKYVRKGVKSIEQAQAIAARRAQIREWLTLGWGPAKMADTVLEDLEQYGPLFPKSELQPKALYALIRQEIHRNFSDVAEGQKRLTGYAKSVYEMRMSKLLEDALRDANDVTKGESFRAAQRRLAADIIEKLANVAGVDTQKPKITKEEEAWQAEFGEGGVARTKKISDEEKDGVH